MEKHDMNRRSFFSMFTAAIAGVVAGMKMPRPFKMVHYTCFKSEYDPFGDHAVLLDIKRKTAEVEKRLAIMHRKYPQLRTTFWRMRRDFEPPALT